MKERFKFKNILPLPLTKDHIRLDETFGVIYTHWESIVPNIYDFHQNNSILFMINLKQEHQAL